MHPDFQMFQYSSRAKILIHHGDLTDRKDRIDKKQAYIVLIFYKVHFTEGNNQHNWVSDFSLLWTSRTSCDCIEGWDLCLPVILGSCWSMAQNSEYWLGRFVIF